VRAAQDAVFVFMPVPNPMLSLFIEKIKIELNKKEVKYGKGIN